MGISKEILDARKQAITRGSVILADCAVTTPFTHSAPASDIEVLARRIAAAKVRLAEVTALIQRLRA